MFKAFFSSIDDISVKNDDNIYPLNGTVEDVLAAEYVGLIDETNDALPMRDDEIYICTNGAVKYNNNTYTAIEPPEYDIPKLDQWRKQYANHKLPPIVICSKYLYSHQEYTTVGVALTAEELLTYLKREEEIIFYSPGQEWLVPLDNTTFITTENRKLECDGINSDRVIEILSTTYETKYDVDELEAFRQWAKTHHPTGVIAP